MIAVSVEGFPDAQFQWMESKEDSDTLKQIHVDMLDRRGEGILYSYKLVSCPSGFVCSATLIIFILSFAAGNNY